MAEAPSGPPRKTTTYNRFSTMASQNERYNTKDDEFFWLENIMRVAPHKLHSVPGPIQRATFPPVVPPILCTDFTFRGQQNIIIETAFEQQDTFGDPNLRTSWGYINNGDFNSVVAIATCGGGNAPYTATCAQINHYTGDNPTLASSNSPPIPNVNCLLSTTHVGNANEIVWVTKKPSGAGGDRYWFDNGNTFVDTVLPTSNFGGFARTNFAIDSSEIWVFCGPFLDGGPPFVEFRVFNRTTGAILHDYVTFGNDAVTLNNYIMTDNYLYALGALSGISYLWKINRSDGTIADTLILTAINPNFIAVANDSLIYVLCSGTPAKIYYLENFTDLTYVGNTNADGFSPFSGGTAIWNNGTLYYGSNGFAGFSVDVKKIVVACPDPDGPLIASVTTDPTVVHGADLTVNWADVLVPDATDKILIKPEPASGVLGLVGSTVASATNTLATGNGTATITIPGGTTPGNYVAMYAALNQIWVTTSAVFTVT